MQVLSHIEALVATPVLSLLVIMSADIVTRETPVLDELWSRVIEVLLLLYATERSH